MSVIQNIEVSVSEVLICELELYIGMRLRPLMLLVFLGVQHTGIFTLQYSVGVAKLSVERGF